MLNLAIIICHGPGVEALNYGAWCHEFTSSLSLKLFSSTCGCQQQRYINFNKMVARTHIGYPKITFFLHKFMQFDKIFNLKKYTTIHPFPQYAHISSFTWFVISPVY